MQMCLKETLHLEVLSDTTNPPGVITKYIAVIKASLKTVTSIQEHGVEISGKIGRNLLKAL